MIRTLLTFALAALGIAAVAGLLDPTGTPLVVAVVVMAALALAVLIVSPVGQSAASRITRSDFDVRVLPAQSNPDAAGHSRPRAPGITPLYLGTAAA